MATRDSRGVLRPGMFEEIPLDDDGTVATPVSGRGHLTQFKVTGKNATPDATFVARSKEHARYAAASQGVLRTTDAFYAMPTTTRMKL